MDNSISPIYKIMFADYPDIVTVAQLQEMLHISRQLAYDLSAQPDELPSAAWNQLLRAFREANAPDSEAVWASVCVRVFVFVICQQP